MALAHSEARDSIAMVKAWAMTKAVSYGRFQEILFRNSRDYILVSIRHLSVTLAL